MRHTFYVLKKSNRLKELQNYLKGIPSARFENEPLEIADAYYVTITIDSLQDIEDGKLNLLLNKWSEQDDKILNRCAKFQSFNQIFKNLYNMIFNEK